MLSHTELIERDRTRLLHTITRTVETGQKYAFVEFPDHANVGDSAIWLGSLRLLTEAMGAPPSYVCRFNYDKAEMVSAIGEGPIFVHGGGNFGDIYPEHQEFKRRVITDNLDRQIVLMPQTVEFRSDANAGPTREAFAAHRNLHMLVRDDRSVAYCRDHIGIDAELAPDGAFGLGPLPRARFDPKKVVALLRLDIEAAGYDRSLLPLIGATAVDWPQDEDNFEAVLKRATPLRLVTSRQFGKQARRLEFYKMRAERRLRRGLALLDGGMVLTDRLHGHILSVLLGYNNVCLDNDYGKVHSYIDAFTGDTGLVKKAGSMAEAVEIIRGVPTQAAA